MNEMYTMSHYIHVISLIAYLLILVIMLLTHKRQMLFDDYVKKIGMYMVFHITLMSFFVLTGAIMMAAKHLSFTAANLLMILSVVLITALEIRRNKLLAKASKYKLVGEDECKASAFKYQLIELILVLCVSAFAGMNNAIPA